MQCKFRFAWWLVNICLLECTVHNEQYSNAVQFQDRVVVWKLFFVGVRRA